MRLCSYEVVKGGDSEGSHVLHVWELAGFWERLAGLMAPRARLPPATVVFPRCRSVHTCAMGFAVDVAFVNAGGEVVRTVRGCRPWRLLVCPGASMAVERPARDGPWLEPGDVLSATAATQGERGDRP